VIGVDGDFVCLGFLERVLYQPSFNPVFGDWTAIFVEGNGHYFAVHLRNRPEQHLFRDGYFCGDFKGFVIGNACLFGDKILRLCELDGEEEKEENFFHVLDCFLMMGQMYDNFLNPQNIFRNVLQILFLREDVQ
jgi:hypothetical protein